MSVLIRWFLSKTVRQATEMRRHVYKLMRAQCDLLSPQAVEAITVSCKALQNTVAATTDTKQIETAMEELEKVANKWLKPYPAAAVRENIEVFLVAIAVAMGIRTFCLQPFKIPTGSMQPTLYGITEEDLRDKPDIKVPTGFQAFVDSWFHGLSYYHIVAKSEGELRGYDKPTKFLLFNLKQTFYVGTDAYTVWFPPDNLLGRAGLTERSSGMPYGRVYKVGEDIMKVRVRSGDHLFVDRMSYNFRRPQRGEIIVFETFGIRMLPQDQFYIKRMVAMGNEEVRIGNDQHLVINGKRLDASIPRFENVYTFNPAPQDGKYFGHVNEITASKIGKHGLAPLFPDPQNGITVPNNHYLAMGDNTLNSFDSRAWGDLPQENVIGKSFFVYWPFTERFGWSHLTAQ